VSGTWIANAGICTGHPITGIPAAIQRHAGPALGYKGIRPRMVHQQQSKSVYIFAAVCPLYAIVIGLVLPYANTQTKAPHLTPSTLTVPPAPHALLAVDQPGWHTASKLSSLLIVSVSLLIVSVSSLAAELPNWSPATQVCQRLRERSLAFTVLA
jgi:hypothetical protein